MYSFLWHFVLICKYTHILDEAIRNTRPEDYDEYSQYQEERSQAEDPGLALSFPAALAAHGGTICGMRKIHGL